VTFLLLAGLVYMATLFGVLLLVQAWTEDRTVRALLIAAATSALWVWAMYLLFRGLVEVGVFDMLLESR
jgi:hypothetical protein